MPKNAVSQLGEKAKQTLAKFVPEIDKVLAGIWDREAENYFGYNEHQKALAREMVTHSRSHNLAPSKRIRSAFVVQAYKLSKKPMGEGIWRAAAAIELVHTALLMQDDFMDEDLLRRGQETSNAYYAKKYGKHYGDGMAVMCGDVALSLGYETLCRCGLSDELVLEAMAHLQRTVLDTAIGQAQDVTLGHLSDWREEDVLAVHRAKTGLYTYENPLMVGAILGGANQKTKEILKRYAMDGGVAFQLQDDILGVFGDSDKTGKSADSDLLQGKATLLVRYAFDHGTAAQVEAIKRVWGKLDEAKNETAALEVAKQALVASGAWDYNRQLAKKLATQAAETAGELRDLDLDGEAIDFIQGVAMYMVEREV